VCLPTVSIVLATHGPAEVVSLIIETVVILVVNINFPISHTQDEAMKEL